MGQLMNIKLGYAQKKDIKNIAVKISNRMHVWEELLRIRSLQN